MNVEEEKLLYSGLRELRTILKRIEALLEEQLIGNEEPLPDEVDAIGEYEDDKKKRKIELVNLNEALRGQK